MLRVRQRGLIVGIELEKNVATHEAYRPNDAVGAKVAILAREQGLICRPIGDVSYSHASIGIHCGTIRGYGSYCG